MRHYFDDPERLARLARTRSPDRERWAAPSSYKPGWAERGRLAARFIRDGSKVLEIGAGTGTLRSLIAHRCRYTGADLEPLDDKTLALDLDNDPMPPGSWDTIVLLGVLEYLHHPTQALGKMTSAAPHIVMSYCCSRGRESDGVEERRRLGWINDMTEHTICNEMETLGFRVAGRELLNSTQSFEQVVFEFGR